MDRRRVLEKRRHSENEFTNQYLNLKYDGHFDITVVYPPATHGAFKM